MSAKIIPLQTYTDGTPYRPAHGRHAPTATVGDRLLKEHAVVDMEQEKLSAEAWVERIVREMRIRFYQPKTVKAYRIALSGLLRWLNRPPHEITGEHLRQYLELLVDGGSSSSWVGVNLSAARTAFDKMCGQGITRGLMAPRRPKQLPLVLSPDEVLRILEAAPSLRDKLLLGVMYATGLRVGEVVRLRWRDLDRDRGIINVWQGKGRKDRQVMLPESIAHLVQRFYAATNPQDYVFAGLNKGRHVSPRTVQHAMNRATKLAGIQKQATTHSLRHAFATHLLENGIDIRFIQRLLGHKRLETTRIYTNVAARSTDRIVSPLDTLLDANAPRNKAPHTPLAPVGRLRIELKRDGAAAEATLWIVSANPPVCLDGIVLKEARPGWISMDLPPLEAWSKKLLWLPRAARERFEDPEFYDQLKNLLAEKYMEARGVK